MDLQPCSVARLMSSILGEPLEQTFPAAGLKLCPWCDQASMKVEYYPFCNRSCLYQIEHQKVPLECSECGRVVMLTKSHLIWRNARSTSGRMYCSKRCQGAWLARTHGFGTRPENIGRPPRALGTQCKNGHAWILENISTGCGVRYCKLCNRDNSRRQREKRKAAKGG